MRRRNAAWAAGAVALGLAGCGAGVDESDQAAVREEFSGASYESAMRSLGREGEWRSEQEAALRRAEEEGRAPDPRAGAPHGSAPGAVAGGGDFGENSAAAKPGNPEEHRDR